MERVRFLVTGDSSILFQCTLLINYCNHISIPPNVYSAIHFCVHLLRYCVYKSIIILCTIKCITCTQCTFLHISLYCKSLFKVFSCYCIYPTNTTLHSYLVSTPSAMTDQERDEIDSAAEEFIHSCSEKIETLHHRGDTCTVYM